MDILKQMIEEINDYLFDRYGIEKDYKIEKIIRSFPDDCRDCNRRKWYQKGYYDGIRKYEKVKQWTLVSERMPEEHDIMITKDAKRLGVWNSWMHEKCSNEVEITIEIFAGKRIVSVGKTYDGEWVHPMINIFTGKVIAWRELPEPYEGE